MPKSKTTTTTETALRSLQAAKAAAAQLGETETALRSRHRELTKERRNVAGAAPALPELLASVEALVDRARDKWREGSSGHVARSIGGHTTTRGGGDLTEVYVRPELPQFGPEDRLTFAALAGLAPDLVKRSLAETLEARGPDAFGLPAAERRERLRELDAELQAVEAQHCELVDGASACGITLPLLEHVADARKRKADAERERADIDRQRLEAERRGLPAPQPTYYVTR
jgi:hypothetical protein